MEGINNTVRPAVTVKPDQQERRQIRKRYNLAALIIIINTVILNGIGKGVIIITCMILGGGFDFESYMAGKQILVGRPVLLEILSCAPVILSETVSILLGMKLLKVDMKKLVSNREGYGMGTMAKLITLSFGIQFAAVIIVTIIQSILDSAGLSGATIDLVPTSSFAADLIMIFYVCILGPILEEMLYRGIILQSMRKYSERFAIFLSALIFGLMHQNYQQCIPAIAIGIPLAMIAVKYNSIIPSIFTHIFLNSASMLQLYLIQYINPGFYEAASADASSIDLSAIDGATMAVLMLNMLIRIAFLIAALVVGIVSLVKGGNMKTPTPAGKSRALPVFVTAALWWVVFAAYLFLTFIEPFLG